MSTKLDKWIEQFDSKYAFTTALGEAINEYRATRQWVEGPPPEGCNAAYVVTASGSVITVVRHAKHDRRFTATEPSSYFIEPEDILRHCPIPPAPPLPEPPKPEPPKPAIPEEVAKHGDGWYRISFDCWPNVVRRIENNHVLRVAQDPMHVNQYVQKWGVTSWKYLGDIPREVAEHGDGWYWRGGEVVQVIGRNYLCCGSNAIRQLTNDGCTCEYIPRRGGE